MDRRSFIKLTAITSTSATLASCGNPENTFIRFVPDEEIVPGTSVYKPSVCPLCSAGCGLTVRVMDADADVIVNGQAGLKRIAAAKKLDGNAMHPISQGTLCARGQAAIQVTYHPDRITQPLKLSGARGEGKYEAISWDAALMELIGKLDALAAAGNQKALAFATRPGSSHRQMLVEQFLARFGAPGPLTFELFGDQVLRRANALSFGRDQLPTFDLGNARSVISFGADFLGTWNSPVAHSVAYGHMRQGRPGLRGSLTQVEARMSLTGASADEWVPATPGTEGVLALALANVILAAKLRPADAGRAGTQIDGWAAGLPAYAPQQVEKIVGVSAARIERMARSLVELSPSVAIVGGPPLAQTNGLFTALAVNALNALLGSVEQPGGMYFTPRLNIGGGGQSAAVPPTLDTLADAGVQVLLVDGSNPVFTAPAAWKVRETFEKIPFIVSFGSFVDETSSLADLILPDHSFLESWVDAVPESGSTMAVASVAAPVMRPLHQTRAMPDVLLDVSRRLATPLTPAFPETFDAMLATTFMALPPAAEGGDAWFESQTNGGWWGQVPAAMTVAPRPAEVAAPPAPEPRFDGDAQQFPFHFLPYPSLAFLDGSLAHLPWLQEMPDPLTSAMWSSWVEINNKTAERLGIHQGDVVEVASSQGTVGSPGTELEFAL